jgi:hypothetical protein
VCVHFVDEFVEVMFVALAEIDEGLYCLVWVGGDVLLAAFVDDLVFISRDLRAKEGGTYMDHVIDEYCEVGYRVVDVCRLVDANKRLIEDREEVSK